MAWEVTTLTPVGHEGEHAVEVDAGVDPDAAAVGGVVNADEGVGAVHQYHAVLGVQVGVDPTEQGALGQVQLGELGTLGVQDGNFGDQHGEVFCEDLGAENLDKVVGADQYGGAVAAEGGFTDVPGSGAGPGSGVQSDAWASPYMVVTPAAPRWGFTSAL